MKKVLCLIMLLGTLLAGTTKASAQTTVTLAAGTPRNDISFRSAEVMHTTKSKVVIDIMYYGFTDDNELWLGLGRTWDTEGKNGKAAATPIVWFVKGKENEQAGVGTGGYYSASYKRLNASASMYAFFPTNGSVPTYFYLDGLDGTFVLDGKKRFELGPSTAIFKLRGAAIDGVTGAVFKVNWKIGTTSFYGRGGSNGGEFRISQTINF